MRQIFPDARTKFPPNEHDQRKTTCPRVSQDGGGITFTKGVVDKRSN